MTSVGDYLIIYVYGPCIKMHPQLWFLLAFTGVLGIIIMLQMPDWDNMWREEMQMDY